MQYLIAYIFNYSENFYSQVIERWNPVTEEYLWAKSNNRHFLSLKEVIKEFSKGNTGFLFASKESAIKAAKIIKVLNDIEDFEEDWRCNKFYSRKTSIYIISKNGTFETI